jgi:hypothetical protein
MTEEEIQIRITTALTLIGSKHEILIVLSALLRKGFKWKTNGKYYPQRDNQIDLLITLITFMFFLLIMV